VPAPRTFLRPTRPGRDPRRRHGHVGRVAADVLRKGATKAIEHGFGGLLDQLLGKESQR